MLISPLRNLSPLGGIIRSGNSFPSTLTDKFLYDSGGGSVIGGQLNNQLKGTTDFLTVTGSGLTAVYETPDTAAYKNADTDNFWWKTNGTRSVTTGQRLVDYDPSRTIIKFTDNAPHVVQRIIILKADAVLTATEISLLHKHCYLSVFWSGVANFNGHFKANRVAAKSVWSAESVLDAATVALVARMAATGETPSGARQTAMDTLIVGLKAANLFGTRFNAFWVGRNTGLASSKMNWIQNAFNLTKGGVGTLTFTDDIGYQSNGSTTYLDTNLKPETAGLLGSQNDISWGFKTGGSKTNQAVAQGVYDGYAPTCGINVVDTNGGTVSARCTGNNVASGLGTLAVGYTCLTRLSSTAWKFLNNANSVDVTDNSTALPSYNLCYLGVWVGGTGMLSPTTNEVFELGWYGKGITPAEFATIQSLFNAYIAAL